MGVLRSPALTHLLRPAAPAPQHCCDHTHGPLGDCAPPKVGRTPPCCAPQCICR
ncbi:hypothetical protein IEO21_10944 [Rhodonia placenta]|uniref:Uncharacterized protein n=1 Tax=Rhodonia placenta TaxID=104341 RepID=A0A8H7TVJ8_9APHY|nr:hypothetical protein IEO21_10944 [Postia placenta]